MCKLKAADSSAKERLRLETVKKEGGGIVGVRNNSERRRNEVACLERIQGKGKRAS